MVHHRPYCAEIVGTCMCDCMGPYCCNFWVYHHKKQKLPTWGLTPPYWHLVHFFFFELCCNAQGMKKITARAYKNTAQYNTGCSTFVQTGNGTWFSLSPQFYVLQLQCSLCATQSSLLMTGPLVCFTPAPILFQYAVKKHQHANNEIKEVGRKLNYCTAVVCLWQLV